MSASFQVFQDCSVSCCLLQLGQSVFHKAQSLQQAYTDPYKHNVRNQTRLLLALVHVADVPRVFRKLSQAATAALHPVMQYFEETCVGTPLEPTRSGFH